jgi:hypothetical protein
MAEKLYLRDQAAALLGVSAERSAGGHASIGHPSGPQSRVIVVTTGTANGFPPLLIAFLTDFCSLAIGYT